MRWLCLILALFFLCMDLEPCKDRVSIVSRTANTITTAHSHQSRPVQDQCPPMCHCGCCNVQVVFAQKMTIKPAEPISLPKQIGFVSEKTVTRPANIWQPPQLNV